MSVRQAGTERRDERGATLIIVAMFLTALMIIAAMVIDLSLVRQNRQTDKSATDFAAAAGIRGLDDGAGVPKPWKGICAARDFLIANNSEEFGSLSRTDGAGNSLPDVCSPPLDTPCAGVNTWIGETSDRRIKVTIESGYPLPDPDFAEDSASGPYGGEVGAACDHLAVIVEERESANFGGVAGAAGYDSRIRSVGRLEQTPVGLITAALLILERTDCPALLLEGSSGANIRVGGTLTAPGVIHADSLASGGNCASGKVFQVNGASTPVVVAEASGDGTAPGQITTVAASTNPGASSSGTPSPVCVQLTLADCGITSPYGSGTIESRNLVGRGVVDVRYREPIIDLRDTAFDPGPGLGIFEYDPTGPSDVPAGYEYYACGDPGPFADAKVWIDCNGGEWLGIGRAFTGLNQTVVIDGRITVSGGGSLAATDPAKQLFMGDVDRLYVRGESDQDAIYLAGTNNSIQINNGTANAACPTGPTSDLSEHTEIVVGQGPILAEGGSGKVLRMCNTMVYMMHSSGTTPCPIPTSDGAAPYDNDCAGSIRVSGQNGLDWTAPNFTDGPGSAYYDDFEDLAYWSETQNGNSIEGQGGVTLAGIFFTPNATPFRVGGNGTYDITDAQFITRRLQVGGNATLRMAPEPNNAVQIPELGGFGLVR